MDLNIGCTGCYSDPCICDILIEEEKRMARKCGYHHFYMVGYGRPCTSRGTMYYEIHGDIVKFSLAYTSKKDKFVKKIGRELAKARFDAGEIHEKRIPIHTFIEEALLKVVKDKGEFKHLPQWVNWVG